MIPKSFIYCLPDYEQEAVDAYRQLHAQGKKALYYGSGSEIITMSAAGSIAPDAVIDLKAIPAMQELEERDGKIIIGGAVTLERIRLSGLFPLLGTTGARIADHTNQCRITLGGNLCGTVIYREASLPLLLADAHLTVWGPDGIREAPMKAFFQGKICLAEGEFLHHVTVDAVMARKPFAHIKQTMSEKIGYPAVTVAALFVDGQIRIAVSGLCHEPFRSAALEAVLNDTSLSTQARIDRAANTLPMPPLTDPEGSGEYRVQLFKTILWDIWEKQCNEMV